MEACSAPPRQHEVVVSHFFFFPKCADVEAQGTPTLEWILPVREVSEDTVQELNEGEA